MLEGEQKRQCALPKQHALRSYIEKRYGQSSRYKTWTILNPLRWIFVELGVAQILNIMVSFHGFRSGKEVKLECWSAVLECLRRFLWHYI